MKRQWIICLMATIWGADTFLQAQTTVVPEFVHIGVEQGLSQSTVMDMVQDEQGNLWMATYHGLNRYDGYSFTQFRHEDDQPHSLAGDRLRTLTIDSHRRLWIGGNGGLSLYIDSLERFTNFPTDTLSPAAIDLIEEVNSDWLWTVSNQRIKRFHIPTRTWSEHLSDELRTLSVTALLRHGERIYIGTQRQGIYTCNLQGEKLQPLPVGLAEQTTVLAFLQPTLSTLWIATEGKGLIRHNLLTGESRRYHKGDGSGLSSDFVRTLSVDAQGNLWAGTVNGLNIYNETSDRFTVCDHNPTQASSLSQTSVRCIYKDSQEGMWVGTYWGGANYYHPLKHRFARIFSHPFNTNSLNNDIIGCITEDGKEELWIGTNNGGVNRYNPATGQFTHYTLRDGLQSNDIKHIHTAPDGTIYIGTHTGGLSLLHPNGRITTLLESGAENVYAILPAANGKYWLSNLTYLSLFDPHTKAIQKVIYDCSGYPIEAKRATLLYRDSKQRIWLCGEEGVSIYRETESGLVRCQPTGGLAGVEHKFTSCMLESRNGIFYIGTRQGLYSYNENQGEWKHCTTREGLADNGVHSLLEDNRGRLWVATDHGLCCLNPADDNFRNYTRDDGVQGNRFIDNACCRTSDGQMWFGGINGITHFHPDQLIDNPYTPPVLLTRLRLFNRTVAPGDETGILQQSIGCTRHITLQPDQSMFSIDLAVPNYIAGTHSTFAYRLEGYDRNWYTLEQGHTLTYSNLPQGTYRLKVKAANNDGRWNSEPAVLTVTMLPVWWRTWWATLLWIAIILAGIAFVIRYFWVRKSMEARLQMERIDKQRQTELNEMKVRFFINISHELRTPLTLIAAPLQGLKEKVTDRWIIRQLEYIQRNTNRLLYLVNQLMDYRRAELGVFELKAKPIDVHQVAKKIFLFYERIAADKQLTYNFCSEVEGKELLCDPVYLELITNNLLSNAFKYTGTGKSITLTLKEEEGGLLLQVADTGQGIPADKQQKIFERFYQCDDQHPGSGIGLSLIQRLVDLHHGHISLQSREGEGSTFTIWLPTAVEVYRPEELAGTGQSEETAAHTTNQHELYMDEASSQPNETEAIDEPCASAKEGNDERETVLLVEDEADSAQYLSEELGTLYRVRRAGNGREALDLLKEEEPDLVLSDVMMPVMDGLQLCRNIKQSLRTCHIPVILLTAKVGDEEELEGLNVGADDYITKPFTPAKLKAKIRNLLRTHRRAIEHYARPQQSEPEKLALNKADEELLKRAVEVVKKHLDDVNFSSDDFAREMFMSRSNLYLKLKAVTGEPANEFVRKIRFEQACLLLKEGRYTIAEVSAMVGFNTPSYFAQSFKKYFGCQPSEYIGKSTPKSV